MVRCSRVPSLEDLCLDVIEHLNCESIPLTPSERFFLFRQFISKKKLSKKTLSLLISDESTASSHFLNRYNEANFSQQPITDDCIPLIYKILPTFEEAQKEINKKTFLMSLDLSNCLYLNNPPSDFIDENRGKLPILALSLKSSKYLLNIDFIFSLCCPNSIQILDLSQCRTLPSSQVSKK